MTKTWLEVSIRLFKLDNVPELGNRDALQFSLVAGIVEHSDDATFAQVAIRVSGRRKNQFILTVARGSRGHFGLVAKARCLPQQALAIPLP